MVRRLLPGMFLTLMSLIGVTIAAQAAQAAPTNEGRWKLDMGVCYWEANDEGPDQCDPTIGRWKLDGRGNCYFANDPGEDQCSPTDPTESEVATSETPVRTDNAQAAGADEDGHVAGKR